MRQLILGLMMAFAVTAAKSATSETDFEFGNGVIKKYKGTGGDVEIPSPYILRPKSTFGVRF